MRNCEIRTKRVLVSLAIKWDNAQVIVARVRVCTNVQQVLYIVCTCVNVIIWCMHADVVCTNMCMYIIMCVSMVQVYVCTCMIVCSCTTMLWVNELDKKDYNSTLIISSTSTCIYVLDITLYMYILLDWDTCTCMFYLSRHAVGWFHLGVWD